MAKIRFDDYKWFMAPFHTYSRYLNEKYGGRAYRVAVDAGFSCPNRGIDRNNPGCTFCDGYGALAPYQAKNCSTFLFDRETLRKQVEQGIRFIRKRYEAGVFLLYFQAFSNTYAPPDKLKEVYDFTLSLADFKEIIVSTRPDCIDTGTTELLRGYLGRGLDVWVELGLQSVHARTLTRIKRGHRVGVFNSSFRLLKGAGIKVAVHLIFGLPGEDWKEILKTVNVVAQMAPDGIKIHNLHIPRGTEMYAEYLRGELAVPSASRHLEYVIGALEHLPDSTVVMRLTCDTPVSRLAAPLCFSTKGDFYNTLISEMKKRGTWQGRLFSINRMT